MKIFAVVLFFLPAVAMSQFQPHETDSPSFGEDETYFDFGHNYSLMERRDLVIGGMHYERYSDYSAFGGRLNGFGFDDEEIEEIVVVAKRRVRRGWDLFMYMDLNIWGQEVCTHWTDGGYCNGTQTMYDPSNMPIDGGCQTIEGTTGPLTGDEANLLNEEHLNGNAIRDGLMGVAGTGLGYGAGGLPGLLIGLGTTGIITANNINQDLPFTTGDTVSWSLTACNDGEGGVDTTFNAQIG